MDCPVKIATTERRDKKKYKNTETTWGAVKERCRVPVRTTETAEEYPKLPKAQQDALKDVGGFVGSHLKSGIRKNGNVIGRRIGTLDADHISTGIDFPFLAELALGDIEYFIYSTHKHTPEAPRLRLVILFGRDVTEDEYPAVMRMAAQTIGLDYFDDTTYQPNRMMYWPSCPSNGEFVFIENAGKALDPNKYLAMYADWRDCSLWPTSSRQSEVVQRNIRQQQDPTSKDGVVGAFCRVYPVEDAISAFLSTVYTPSSMSGRYDYILADSSAGVVLYDSLWAYSHHATDPACGKLLNAFDLVRIHKFGDSDEKKSFKLMSDFAVKDEQVKEELLHMRYESAKSDFTKSNAKTPRFVVFDKNGVPTVQPAYLAQHFRDTEDYFITHGHSGGQQFWVYRGGVYEKTSDDDIRGTLDGYIRAIDPSIVESKYSNEAFKQLKGDGVGFGKYLDTNLVNADEDIIIFENGVLHLGTGELTAYSPEYKSTIKLPLNWNPAGKNKPVFEKYLNDLTKGDEEKKLLLKEFFGLTLSNIFGYRTKKAVFLVGPGDSGKSQLRELLIRLIGHKNNTDSDLSKLDERFMTGTIYGKRLIGHGDCSFAEMKELKVFKMLTGGDSLFVENKFTDAFSGKFTGTILFGMNRLPDFGGDLGRHVFERIIIISCPDIIPEALRDPTICDKMYAEREAIVAECIKALHGLIQRGYKFTEPKTAVTAREEYALEQSTVRQFAVDCNVVIISPDAKKSDYKIARTVYADYVRLCHDYGQLPNKRKRFTAELAEALGVHKDLLYQKVRIGNSTEWAYAIDYKSLVGEDFLQ